MTSVNEMNAVMRERARIREAVCTLEHFIKNGDTPNNVLVRRGDVLAILTENMVQAYKVPVKCECNKGELPKTGRFHGTLDDGTPISIGYKIIDHDALEGITKADLLEVSVITRSTGSQDLDLSQNSTSQRQCHTKEKRTSGQQTEISSSA